MVHLVVNNYEQINGLSRYARSLHHELKHIPAVGVKLVPVGVSPIPAGLKRLARWLGFDLDAFFQTYPVTWPSQTRGMVHLTNRTQATLLIRKLRWPVVVTVHDIIHHQYRRDPTMHIYRHAFQAWMDALSIRVLRRADAILASSDYTRQALLKHVGLQESRVHRVYLGVDGELFKPCTVPAAFYERYSLSPQSQYILHISSGEPRKNLPTLVRAFAEVRRRHPDVKLLKVGRTLYLEAHRQLQEQITHLGLGNAVVFIEDVPDHDLVFFYNASRVFAFPSRAEGFGFPVLEAMACGTPVVCSAAGSLPEVAGEAALFADPDDVDGLARAICRVLEDEALREQLRERGRQQAAKFTWARTARETVEVYRAVDRTHPFL